MIIYHYQLLLIIFHLKYFNNFNPCWSLSKTSDDEFERIKQITSATLKPRSCRLGLEIKHNNPALLLEWYQVSVCLMNLEDRPVSDVCLNLSLNRNNNEKVEHSSKYTIINMGE